MSPRPRRLDPDRELPLIRLIEEYTERRERELAKIDRPPVEEPLDPDLDPEAELHAEIKTACVRAIRSSGLSRDQVVDRINERFPRQERDRTSIHMLNNYLALSKPDSRLPITILLGICLACDDFTPFEILVERGGRHIVTDSQLIEQQIGALDRLQRELAREKARTRRLLEGSTAGDE